MKSAILLAFLSFSLSAYANEEANIGSDDVAAYCEEQAQLAGIVDANEIKMYLQDCIDSFSSQTGGTGQSTE